MTDNVTLTAAGGATFLSASDEIGGVQHQRVKMEHGADGEAHDVSETRPMPVADRVANVVRTRTVYNAGATPVWTPTTRFRLMAYQFELSLDTNPAGGGFRALIVQLRDGAEGPVLAEHAIDIGGGGGTYGPITLGAGLWSQADGRALYVHLSQALMRDINTTGLHLTVAGVDEEFTGPASDLLTPGLPTITSVAPDPLVLAGAGGDTVTVTGTNLVEPAAYVLGVPVTDYDVNPGHTELTFAAPPYFTGNYSGIVLTVANPFGEAEYVGALEYTGPTIESIDPPYTSSIGNQTITVTGTNLTGTTELFMDSGANWPIGLAPAPFTDIDVAPDGLSLTAVSPATGNPSNTWGTENRRSMWLSATAGTAIAEGILLVHGALPELADINGLDALDPATGPAETAVVASGLMFTNQPYLFAEGHWHVFMVDESDVATEVANMVVVDDNQFTFTVPADLPAGTYTVRFDFTDGPSVTQPFSFIVTA